MIPNSSKILTEKVLKNLGIPAVCTVGEENSSDVEKNRVYTLQNRCNHSCILNRYEVNFPVKNTLAKSRL